MRRGSIGWSRARHELLRVRRERLKREGRTSEPRDELPPPHP